MKILNLFKRKKNNFKYNSLEIMEKKLDFIFGVNNWEFYPGTHSFFSSLIITPEFDEISYIVENPNFNPTYNINNYRISIINSNILPLKDILPVSSFMVSQEKEYDNKEFLKKNLENFTKDDFEFLKKHNRGLYIRLDFFRLIKFKK
tara:strand:- start:34 stop:474 length:441 start_codon:yes stop_codon:yes gene_type:complete